MITSSIKTRQEPLKTNWLIGSKLLANWWQLTLYSATAVQIVLIMITENDDKTLSWTNRYKCVLASLAQSDAN